MARKQSFGSNFTPRASVGGASESTKKIGFGNLSEEQKKELQQRLLNSKESTDVGQPVDITGILPTGYTIKKIPRHLLKPAPAEWNFFADQSMNKLILLAESVYRNGLLQPIIVREMNPEGTIYQILAGHTRDRVYSLLYQILEDPKYLEIDAMVFGYGTLDDLKAQDIICDTNFMQRGNLPPREMAQCVYLKAKRLKSQQEYGSGSVADKIAKAYNIKRTSVFMWQKLALLSPKLQDVVEARKITLRNAYKLAGLSREDQELLYEKCFNYISNEAIRFIDTRKPVEDIIKTIEENYGVSVKSVRFEIAETELASPKDKPILIYADAKKYKDILEQLKSIEGAYIVRS